MYEEVSTMYVARFLSDLEKAREAEKFIYELFSQMSDDYNFENVGDQREYFHKGDIKAIHKESGREIFIEVKDDSRIHVTKNILCEEEIYFKDNDYWEKGCMHSEYDIYVVISRESRQVYVIDFKKLRKFYKDGEFKVMDHASQTNYCYLYPLGDAAARGALIESFSY